MNEEKVISESDGKLSSETSQYPVGRKLRLQIWVHNSLRSPLDEVTLELNFYQDYLNGTVNNQLGNRLATTGSTKTHKARVSTEYTNSTMVNSNMRNIKIITVNIFLFHHFR